MSAAVCRQSPPCKYFGNYSKIVLQDDAGAPAIWHIVINEYVVIPLLRFLSAARDCAVHIDCAVSWMSRNGRVGLSPATWSSPQSP